MRLSKENQTPSNNSAATNFTMLPSTHTKLPGVFSLLRETLALYKKYFLTFLGITILPSVTAATGFAIIFGIGWASSLFVRPTWNTVLLVELFLGSTALWMIAMGIVHIWGHLTLLNAMTKTETPGTIFQNYRESIRMFFPYLWILFLQGIILFTGTLFFIIPGIIFGIWFSLSSFVFLTEKEQGLAALLKSKAYVKGYSWGIFRRFIALSLILFGCSFLTSMVSAMSITFLHTPKTIIDICTTTLFILLTPITPIYSWLLYAHVVRLKTNFLFAENPNEKTFFTSLVIIGVISIIIIPLLIRLYLPPNTFMQIPAFQSLPFQL